MCVFVYFFPGLAAMFVFLFQTPGPSGDISRIYIYILPDTRPPTNKLQTYYNIYIGCRFLLVLGFASMLFDDDNIQYSKGVVNVF